MFKSLRTRDDLLALVRAHATTNACAHAIDEGRVTIIGGFSILGQSCYLVKITAEKGRTWVIEIAPIEKERRHIVKELLMDIPLWSFWDGELGGKRPLIDGDQYKKEWQELYAKRTA